MSDFLSDNYVLKELEEYLSQYEKIKKVSDPIYMMFLKRIIDKLNNGYYKEMHESMRRQALSDDLKRIGFYDMAERLLYGRQI